MTYKELESRVLAANKALELLLDGDELETAVMKQTASVEKCEVVRAALTEAVMAVDSVMDELWGPDGAVKEAGHE